jgi:hypothetical protein
MEKERGGRATAVLDRPADSKTDPGKKYRVLLFNDNNNTRQFVVEVLMKYIPVRVRVVFCLPSEAACTRCISYPWHMPRCGFYCNLSCEFGGARVAEHDPGNG